MNAPDPINALQFRVVQSGASPNYQYEAQASADGLTWFCAGVMRFYEQDAISDAERLYKTTKHLPALGRCVWNTKNGYLDKP